jgi:hypothetical protein
VIHINWITVALTTSFKKKRGAILIGPSANVFGTLGMPPIKASLWTPVAK